MFAGIVSLSESGTVSREFALRLRDTLSRNPSDRAELHTGEGYVIARVDLGLRPGPDHLIDQDGSGAITLMAGSLLFADHNEGDQATRDLQRLHHLARTGALAELAQANGSYCAVFFDPAQRRVWLIGDSLGLRPLYYQIVDGFLLFSTSMRVLEAMPGIARETHLGALWQLASMGYAIGNATPYQNIHTVVAAEVVEVRPGAVRRQQYMKWEDLKETPGEEGEFLDRLHAAFIKSLRRRLDKGSACLAFLSGGLDSRCIVAGLRALGREVHTMNFAPEGSADLVLGRLSAQSLGTRHFEASEGPLDYWERMLTSHSAWLQATPASERPASPNIIWTGYAGETLLAPTNVSDEILRLLRAGKVEEALTAYFRLEGISEPGILFSREIRRLIGGSPREAMRQELGRLGQVDLGTRLHTILLSDAMRWHLARHHDDLDLRRVEFEFPFLDTAFLRVTRAYPLIEFMEHRLYHRWLSRFQPAVSNVAWQAYPGHDPCPIPMPAGLRLQWPDWYSNRESRAMHRQIAAKTRADLGDKRFERTKLRRPVVLMAAIMTTLGFQQYSYLLRIARVFLRYTV